MTITTAFQAAFGTSPDRRGSAPGRVNLIGEHIDYNGGTVLPAAINRRVAVALAPNGGRTHKIQSARYSTPIIRPMADPPSGHWSDYAVGALQSAAAEGGLQGGIDLYIESDLPDGAGVSSSAALITAILRAAMPSNTNTPFDPTRLAHQARAVETDYIGVPCGIMDQMAVGLATPNEALALNTHRLSHELIPIPPTWRFITLHSGVHRKLSDGRYKTRFEECAAAREALGVPYLCTLTSDDMARLGGLPASLAARARHVISEADRTHRAIAALKTGDPGTFGQLMRESHRSYTVDFDASTPTIDELVESACALGAYGARLTGGGFGGCIVALVRADKASAWRTAFLERHPAAAAI